MRGIGFVAYALATQYVTFLLLTLPLMALEAATPPLQQSLVAQLFAGDARIRVMSSIRAARNVALGAGTLVAGAALTTHSQPLVAALLAINGTSFLILAWVVHSLRRSAIPPAQQQEKDCGSSRPALRNPAFLSLAGLNGLLLLHDSVLFVLLPLWMVLRLGASPLWVSLMLALNTGLTVAMQLGFGRIRRLTTATNPTLFVAASASSPHVSAVSPPNDSPDQRQLPSARRQLRYSPSVRTSIASRRGRCLSNWLRMPAAASTSAHSTAAPASSELLDRCS